MISRLRRIYGAELKQGTSFIDDGSRRRCKVGRSFAREAFVTPLGALIRTDPIDHLEAPVNDGL